MRDYNVNIRIDRNSTRRTHRNPVHSDWECAYCNGTAINPTDIMGIDPCPACHGGGLWEAEISRDRLFPCGRCRGSGRIEIFGFLRPCNVCGGSGKV